MAFDIESTLAVIGSSDRGGLVAEPDDDAAEFRLRRSEIYLRSARSHALAAAVAEQTADGLELRHHFRAAAEHRQVAEVHRSKAARHRLLAERYSPSVP